MQVLVIVYGGRIGKIMRKRLISVCFIAIIVFSVYACGQTVSDNPAAETEIAGKEDTEIVEKEDTETRIAEKADAETGSEEDEVTEEEAAELFNSQGVCIQILSEGDEKLSESERAKFLAAFGFSDSEQFYVHDEEDGYPFMELYFDEERGIGCGIRYAGSVICGFAFDHCQEVSWHERDPYSVLSVYGTTGEDRVTDYREKYEYDEEGRLIGYQSTGTPTDIEGEEWKDTPMITVAFTYDDGGRLQEKEYSHFTTPHLPFGTTYASQTSYYDESGRLAHTASYITHGGLEGYYIYQGDHDVPAYYLELDHQYTSWPTFYRFVNRIHNWEFGGFRRSTEAQDQTYEIEPGEEADFLTEQGFTEDDLFYECEYAGAPDVVFCLSLYCDEYVTRGVGFIREYEVGEYIDLEIFTFDGCVQYLDDAAVGQYSVYSTYDDGRETYFLDEETIDDYFGAKEPDEIHSVSFDYEDGELVHMEQRLAHGSVDRFYFYKYGDQSYRCGPCMLEVDHGWGVSLYRF